MRRLGRLALAVVVFALTGCSGGESDAPSAARDAPDERTTTMPPPSSTTTTTTIPAPPVVVTADAAEDVFAYGTAFHGSTSAIALAAPIVDVASTPSGGGYWLLGADGGVFAYGDAVFAGAAAGLTDAVALASTPSGQGYWLVTARGQVRTFGDAVDHGAAVDLPATRRVVGFAANPTGDGYRIALHDGGVLGFGAAAPGAPDALPLAAPVVAMDTTRTGQGYVLVAADGGVFAYGDASFAGSAQPFGLRAPAVDIAIARDGGYVIAGADGGVFAFDAAFLGSAADLDLGTKPVTGLAAVGDGYLLARGQSRRTAGGGGVLAIGDSVMLGAGGALQNAIPGITVDATVSRQFHQLPGLLAAYRDRGQLPGTIVVHLGTNGSVTSGDLDAALQIAEHRLVVFVNVWVPRRWEASSNAAISDGAARWGARVADWRSIASQGGMLAGDGYHVNSVGANAYAAMVHAAIG